MTVNEPTIRFKIVIPDESQWTNKQRGDFWEDVSAALFRQQQWEVTQNIEFDGMQTDIYVKNLDTEKTGLIECKFQQELINAPTIFKLKCLYISYRCYERQPQKCKFICKCRYYKSIRRCY